MHKVAIVWRLNSPKARKSDTFAQYLEKNLLKVHYFFKNFPTQIKKS